MSNPHLPPEIFDYIVDLLHDKPKMLGKCCLVSKSWVPRTRKHLFVNIKLLSVKDVQSWGKAFPNDWDSPAHHTRTLSVFWTQAIVEADARAGGLIQTFPRVVRLRLTQPASSKNLLAAPSSLEKISLAPFHKFSSTLKSLHVGFTPFPSPQIFDLVRSLPLLEDLALSGCDPLSCNNDSPHGPQTEVLSSSPVLNGSLDLDILGGIGNITRRLLDLPNGLSFRKLVFQWHHMEDLRWITELVARCSDTLEYLDVKCYPPCTFILVLRRNCNSPSCVGHSSVDLSNATKLRGVVFRPGSPTVAWIIMALQTITPSHRDLQHISIQVPYDFTFIDASADVLEIVGEAISRQWLDLDRLLVHLWESRSIRPKVIPVAKMWGGKLLDMRYCIECLLPEVTKGGIVDLAGPIWSW